MLLLNLGYQFELSFLINSSPRVNIVMAFATADTFGLTGNSRLPGILWTVEAREDIFRRRKADETWETICQIIIALTWPWPECAVLS